MVQSSFTVSELVSLTRSLGAPERDLAVLGEGNTSVLMTGDTFLVKASGASLGRAGSGDFVELQWQPLFDIVRRAAVGGVTDALRTEVEAILATAIVPGGGPRRASIETLVHVLGYALAGAKWVGHTHPTPVVSLMVTPGAAEHYAGAVFPDEAVVCGLKPVFVPYAEPGLPLAVLLYDELRKHLEVSGEPPKQVLLGNHGHIAFGASATEIDAIITMAYKAAQVRLGALAAGGVAPLTAEQSLQIAGRPDEVVRRRDLMSA